MVPTVGVVEAEEVKHIVVVREVPVSHALNGIGASNHFVVDVSLVGKTRHGGNLVFQQVGLEHSTEVMLVFDRVPLKHATGQHTVAVLVVADDLVNPGDTPCDTAAGGFDHLLENGKIQVVKETNRDVDRIAGKTLNHFHDGRGVERCDDGVARLHGLERRSTLHTTNFTDDDVARTATKGCLEQVEHLNARIFVLRITGDQTLPNLVANLDFRRVFCRVDLDVVVDERQDGVERRGFPRCGFSRNQDGHAVFQTDPDVSGLLGGHGPPLDELNHRDGLLGELTNGERRAQHRDVVGENDVDTRAIKQHAVNDGLVVGDRSTDALGHGSEVAREQLPLAETNVGGDHAKHLVVHVDVFQADRVNVFQHLVGQQRLKRSVSNQVPNHHVGEPFPLGLSHRESFVLHTNEFPHTPLAAHEVSCFAVKDGVALNHLLKDVLKLVVRRE